MILPIVGYGHPALREETVDIDESYEDLQELIANMFETMNAASGVGLAAPQINKAIRLFIVDASPFADDDDYSKSEKKVLKSFKKVFINSEIIEEKGNNWSFEEGCLSIPGIREEVLRQEKLTIEYLDEKLKPQTLNLEGLPARIVQHEYDHIEGVLFTDHLKPLKKRLLKRKLTEISKGITDVKYKMKFANLKKR